MGEVCKLTFREITEKAKHLALGSRHTPVVSFWPMRDKWKKYGDYWELWGQDGDLRVVDMTLMAPAEYKLIYFVVPNTQMVCQIAYEVNPEEPETGTTAIRRNNRIAENLRQGLKKVQDEFEHQESARLCAG